MGKQEFANQLIGMEQAFAMMIREVNSQEPRNMKLL